MSTFPKVRFILDPAHDAESAINFLQNNKESSQQQFLRSFFRHRLHFLLGTKFSKKECRKIITAYITDYYEGQAPHFEDRAKQIRVDWTMVQKEYFDLVAKIFENHPWPKGKYIGFFTVFGCYPRFISEKTFLLPIDHKTSKFANMVTAHELIHFMFFDYVEKNYGFKERDAIPNKESNYLWKVSEAFNSVMEGWKPYQKIFKSAPNPYPETMAIYRTMNRQWQKEQDIGKLLDRILK